MKTEEYLCPKCHEGDLVINNKVGAIVCDTCKCKFKIKNGMYYLIDKIPRTVLGEMKAWEKFADSEGWLDPPEEYLDLLPSPKALKFVPGDTITWKWHESDFFRSLEGLNFKNKKVLDVGAGRCWSSKYLTLKGAQVVALDLLDHPTIGLGAGEILMRRNNIKFTRVVADMNNIPFKNELFDYVVISGSLHHTMDLGLTINEITRVLKHGGSLLVTNEPCTRFIGSEVIKVGESQEGINEHSFRINRLLGLLIKNGLNQTDVDLGSCFFDKGSTVYYGGRFWIEIVSRFKKMSIWYLLLFGGTMILKAKKNV